MACIHSTSDGFGEMFYIQVGWSWWQRKSWNINNTFQIMFKSPVWIFSELLLWHKVWLSKSWSLNKINLRVFIPCRIALGNTSNYAALDQMDDLQIYLHEPDNFLFFAYRDTMPNNLKIEKSMLQLSLDWLRLTMH